MPATDESPQEPPTAAEPIGALVGRLDAASEVYRAVVDRLDAAIGAMRDAGTPPGYQLIHQLGDCHRLFLRLRRDAMEAAAAAGRPAEESQFQGLGDILRWAGAPAGRTAPAPAAPAPAPSFLTPPPPVADFPGPDATTASADPFPPPQVIEALAAAPAGPLLPPAQAAPDPAPELDRETLEAIATTRTTTWVGHVGSESASLWKPTVTEQTAPTGPDADPDGPAGSPPPDAEAEEYRRRALPLLERVVTLRPRDDSAVPELDAALDAARALRDALADAPSTGRLEEARRLAHGDHPLAHLLAMVEGDDSLTDEDWTRLHESVSDSFGRPLAVVAARQRLVFDGPGG